MKKKILKPDSSRREFIKTSALAGAGLAAGAALPGAAMASVSEDMPAEKKQQGYQVTQHVIDYYKSAAS